MPVALVMIAAGILHRQAVPDPWADDRLLVLEPSWFQMAAPRLHAAVPDAIGPANVLARLLDPLTRASTSGDVRALAACAAALGAGALFVLLRRRLDVSTGLALVLSASFASAALPVSTAASATHAWLVLLAAALLLILWSRPDTPPWRTPLLVVVTLLGAAFHASFLAFALVIWLAEWWRQTGPRRMRVAGAGLVTLTAGLFIVAWLVHLNASTPRLDNGTPRTDRAGIARPGTVAVASAIVTGRFTTTAQPSRNARVKDALSAMLPGPLILCLPLIAVACVRRETRACALGLMGVATTTWLFASGTWLPDLTIAIAPARLAVVLLLGLGLTWMMAQPVRGARAVAVIAAAIAGFGGFLDPSRAAAPLHAARLQAFVDSASSAIAGGVWTAERVAIDRALLLRAAPGATTAADAGTAVRLPVDVALLQTVPEDRAVIVFPHARERLERKGAWVASFDLAYPTASSFVSSLPAGSWITWAIRDGSPGTEPFWRDLHAVLGATSAPGPLAAPVRRVGLARAGPGGGAAESDATPPRLDVAYGQPIGTTGLRAPAKFSLETEPTARLARNGSIVAETPHGAAIAAFDPWLGREEAWLVSEEGNWALPAIRDGRLRAAYLLAPRTPPRVVRLPVVGSAAARVRFDPEGSAWFGTGWHGPEGTPADPYRWTNAPDAHIHVHVSRRQPLRVRLVGSLAAPPGRPNALGVSWDGKVIHPLSAWNDAGTAEWLIPADRVSRGPHVFTIHVAQVVTPAATQPGADPRPLGAAVHQLTFEPSKGTSR